MHELSLALEVIDLVSKETQKKSLSRVFEMEIEVGTLSGVEAETFQSALEMVVKGTLLEDAKIQINQTFAVGTCSDCQKDFNMKERMATCPDCRSYPSKIIGGDQFRVVSILAE